MELMDIISFGLTATAGIVGWFVKLLWGGQKELREEIKRLELTLIGDYTKHEVVKDLVGDLKKELKDNFVTVCDKINKIDDYLRARP